MTRPTLYRRCSRCGVDPDGRSRGNFLHIKAMNRENGIEITSTTSIPLWYGDWMDHQMAVQANVVAGTVEAVQLGAPNGMGGLTGEITFDAYEAHRTTNVGALTVADANDSGTVTSGDATRILNEVSLGGTLSAGQPDCNENGSITSGDATCVLNIIAL